MTLIIQRKVTRRNFPNIIYIHTTMFPLKFWRFRIHCNPINTKKQVLKWTLFLESWVYSVWKYLATRKCFLTQKNKGFSYPNAYPTRLTFWMLDLQEGLGWHFQHSYLGSAIQGRIGRFLQGDPSPRNLSMGSIRPEWFLGLILRAPVALGVPSDVTLDSSIRGKCAGSVALLL